MRILLALVICSISGSLLAQKRIGVDISTRFENLNITASYHQVIKGNFLVSTGIYFGGMGSTLVLNDTNRLYTGTPIRSPYSAVDQPITDTITTYSLLDYKGRARAVGVQLGIGYFFEFGVVHGLRFNLYSKFGFASNKVGGYYRSTETYTERYQRHYINHFYASVSPEVYHTIRKTGRNTFYWGMKFPYHFSIDKAQFNPLVNKDLLYGFEPELSIGFTHVIGQCE